RIAGRPEVLAAKRSAFGRRGRLRAAETGRRIAARVERAPVLSVVDEVEARSIAAADVEHPVAAELKRSDRVARVLLAPVGQQDVFAARGDVAGRSQPRDPAGDD